MDECIYKRNKKKKAFVKGKFWQLQKQGPEDESQIP
jgi:hypothetical protein